MATTLVETAPASAGLLITADSSPELVDTKLNYLKHGIPEPFFRREPVEGQPSTNIETVEFPAKIRDIRGHEHEYSLDKNGFAFVKHRTSEENIENLRNKNDAEIKRLYYPDVEALLKKETGADRVFIFDYNVRKKTADPNLAFANAVDPKSKSMPQVTGPVSRVHIDQSEKAGFARVRLHLPDEADELLKGRSQIINVWRPLIDGIEDWPLAVADYYSLSEKDLVPTKLIYPDRVGETLSVHHNPNHKWHFLSKQKKDEVILIKCFDSKEDRARLTPHTAFENPHAPPNAAPRESVEIRALVFHTQDRD